MATNPYAGTDHEESWRQGFTAGFTFPDQVMEAPLVLESEQRTVYSEGVLAGQDAATQGQALLSVTPSDNAFGETAGHIAEAVHVVGDVRHAVHTVHVGRQLSAFGTAGWGGFWAVVLFAVLGPNRAEEHYFDRAARESLRRFHDDLAGAGLAGGVELYMPACDLLHGTREDDVMTQQGWWHGMVYPYWEPAQAEGHQHEHPENTRVLRFRSGLDEVEMISLDPIG
ncbi:hypothetical protein [Streptomyces litchfieldiae]|uniref:Uncharacterized protein n=1 Tax=Streptomyces litchfieldiae TaxID=3075543 RepID=A0ABU2MID5_9ACTN|nr:hypothetical protein [Streptomyces sp. DSM 44938]MDT0341358.1 hypothetical protein [Streptomyces sp. DSM 44938]